MEFSSAALWGIASAGLCGASLVAIAHTLSRKLGDARAEIGRLRQDNDRQQLDLTALAGFKSVLDRTLDALYIFSADSYELLYVNQGCAEQLGYDAADLIGHQLRIIKADGGEDAFRRQGELLIYGPRRSVTYDSHHRRRDGSVFPVEIFLQYMGPDADGKAGRFVAIARDITSRREAEAALHNARVEIEAVLGNVPVGICLISPERRLLKLNRAFCSIYGGSESELLGRTTSEFYADINDYEQLSQTILPRIRQGETVSADFQMQRFDDGQQIWCRLTGRLVDPAEPSLGFLWVHDDITDRRRNEQAVRDRQELFEQLFRSNSAIKLLINPVDGRIMDANPAASQFYGYGLERLRGLMMIDLDIHSPDSVRDRVAQLRIGEETEFATRHRLASGEIRDIEVHAGPITVQGQAYLFWIIHDISERIRSEQELVNKTAELQRSNAELEAFAYVASHDLRQPLRMVNSYLALLERHLGDQLDDQAREFMGFAQSGAQRMDRLILDLLDYSRVGRQGGTAKALTAIPLTAVLEDIMPILDRQAQDLGATITWPNHLPTVMADSQELTRLFQNLLENAMKYRSPDRVPVIDITCDRQADFWQIGVTDNGIGIAPEHRDRVFGLFQRLHSAEDYDGTGIGLAICKKIVEHHGGRLWVEGAPGGPGSRFLFTLPAR